LNPINVGEYIDDESGIVPGCLSPLRRPDFSISDTPTAWAQTGETQARGFRCNSIPSRGVHLPWDQTGPRLNSNLLVWRPRPRLAAGVTTDQAQHQVPRLAIENRAFYYLRLVLSFHCFSGYNCRGGAGYSVKRAGYRTSIFNRNCWKRNLRQPGRDWSRRPEFCSASTIARCYWIRTRI